LFLDVLVGRERTAKPEIRKTSAME